CWAPLVCDVSPPVDEDDVVFSCCSAVSCDCCVGVNCCCKVFSCVCKEPGPRGPRVCPVCCVPAALRQAPCCPEARSAGASSASSAVSGATRKKHPFEEDMTFSGAVLGRSAGLTVRSGALRRGDAGAGGG